MSSAEPSDRPKNTQRVIVWSGIGLLIFGAMMLGLFSMTPTIVGHVGRTCLHNGKQVALAAKISAIDNDGLYPDDLDQLEATDCLPVGTLDRFQASYFNGRVEGPIEYLLPPNSSDETTPDDTPMIRQWLTEDLAVIVRADYSGAIKKKSAMSPSELASVLGS